MDRFARQLVHHADIIITILCLFCGAAFGAAHIADQISDAVAQTVTNTSEIKDAKKDIIAMRQEIHDLWHHAGFREKQ